MVRLIQFTMGLQQLRMDAVVLIRQQSCSYSRCSLTRDGLWLRNRLPYASALFARVLVTCGAVVGSCDDAQGREDVYTQADISMVAFLRQAHCARFRDRTRSVARIARLGRRVWATYLR